jgi:hypothetical protein
VPRPWHTCARGPGWCQIHFVAGLVPSEYEIRGAFERKMGGLCQRAGSWAGCHWRPGTVPPCSFGAWQGTWGSGRRVVVRSPISGRVHLIERAPGCHRPWIHRRGPIGCGRRSGVGFRRCSRRRVRGDGAGAPEFLDLAEGEMIVGGAGSARHRVVPSLCPRTRRASPIGSSDRPLRRTRANQGQTRLPSWSRRSDQQLSDLSEAKRKIHL